MFSNRLQPLVFSRRQRHVCTVFGGAFRAASQDGPHSLSTIQQSDLTRSSALLRPAYRDAALAAVRGYDLLRGEDTLKGKLGHGHRSGRLGAMATIKASGKRQGFSQSRLSPRSGFAADPRQRVIEKLHFPNHGGGGGAGKLAAHGKYLVRDGAGPEGEPGQFYDRDGEALDVPARLQIWERDDPRHMRLMLAPESGARMVDMQDFTRGVIERMERDLGCDLEWVAAEHHNTDSPHVHVILRGRRRDGVELIIPREYGAHGIRHAARDVATLMLGDRGREDERMALEREVRSLNLTRLDRLLERYNDVRKPLRIQAIGKDMEPGLAAAMRGRARELARMGLACEIKRDVIQFEPDWKGQLERIGRQLDIKRTLSRPLEPGGKRPRLYSPDHGRITGEVVDLGPRGGDGKRAYLILQPERGAPVFVNTSARAIQGLEKSGVVEIAPSREGRGPASVRCVFGRSPEYLVEARAFTALDQELERIWAGQARSIPALPSVEKALEERASWLELKGLGGRDLFGRFEYHHCAREALEGAERLDALDRQERETGKHALDPHDGLEREWSLRGFRQLHQGRFAELERHDGVALIPIAKTMQLEIGKTYSLQRNAKGLQLSVARELDR